MNGTAAHGNTPPQPPSASVLTLRPTTPDPDKSVHDKRLDPDDPANQALEFRVVGGAVADPSRVPASFRPFPPVDPAAAARTRVWKFDRQNGMWAINGRLFDPEIDHSPASLADPRNQVRRNTSEVWVLENGGGGWEHPIHMHLEEGQAFRVNGVPVGSGRGARRDIHRLGREADRVEVFMNFRDFPDPDFAAPSEAEAGRYVMHCHNTVHEDHAMMVSFTLVP